MTRLNVLLGSVYSIIPSLGKLLFSGLLKSNLSPFLYFSERNFSGKSPYLIPGPPTNFSSKILKLLRSLSPEKSEEIEIFNSPYGDKIGEYNDYLTYYSYEEYGIEYSDHINGRLEIGFSLWINDDVPFSSWLESTSYGYALSTGLVLRSKPDKYSKKIIAFQGGSYDVSVIGWSWGAQEFINGYSKVRVDLYEEDPCDGGSVTKSWEGWAKVIDDFGNPNIYYSAVGC